MLLNPHYLLIARGDSQGAAALAFFILFLFLAPVAAGLWIVILNRCRIIFSNISLYGPLLLKSATLRDAKDGYGMVAFFFLRWICGPIVGGLLLVTIPAIVILAAFEDHGGGPTLPLFFGTVLQQFTSGISVAPLPDFGAHLVSTMEKYWGTMSLIALFVGFSASIVFSLQFFSSPQVGPLYGATNHPFESLLNEKSYAGRLPSKLNLALRLFSFWRLELDPSLLTLSFVSSWAIFLSGFRRSWTEFAIFLCVHTAIAAYASWHGRRIAKELPALNLRTLAKVRLWLLLTMSWNILASIIWLVAGDSGIFRDGKDPTAIYGALVSLFFTVCWLTIFRLVRKQIQPQSRPSYSETLAACLAAICALAWVSALVYCERLPVESSKFAAIKYTMSREEVRALLGKPTDEWSVTNSVRWMYVKWLSSKGLSLQFVDTNLVNVRLFSVPKLWIDGKHYREVNPDRWATDYRY